MAIISTKLSELLNKLGIYPILMDIGCSGDSNKIWEAISSVSTLIGIDPDKRDISSHFGKEYKERVIIDRVVCGDDNIETVEFVFTENPHCSSLLQPDLEELENYIFYEYFVPQSTEQVPATSLNRIMKEKSLELLDWIKIDSQGMDLQILKSLDDRYLSNVVALDVEPGFISAYKGEDLFPDVHEFLVGKGFWLSDLRCQKYPRVNHKSIQSIANIVGNSDKNGIKPFLKGSPTAAEARYLRTISSAVKAGERQLILLHIFSILCGHEAFAYDVKLEHEKIYGINSNNEYMTNFLHHKLKIITFMPHWKHKLVRSLLHHFPSLKQYAWRIREKKQPINWIEYI